jgi:hypothetical protein
MKSLEFHLLVMQFLQLWRQNPRGKIVKMMEGCRRGHTATGRRNTTGT